MKLTECSDLIKMQHLIGISIQSADGGERYTGVLLFEPEPRWHFFAINVFLELDRDFFSKNKMDFMRPKTIIPCENYQQAKSQMDFLMSHKKPNNSWQTELLSNLMKQLWREA